MQFDVTSSVGESIFAPGLPWVKETYISPSSIGSTFENSVVQITYYDTMESMCADND